MNKLPLHILIFASILLAACDFDDTKHADGCAGKYSVVKLKDSIANKYNITTQNIDFMQWHKLPFGREYSCDTIRLEISCDSIPLIYSDTFALSLAKIFFSDTLNSNANSLELTLKEYWSAKFNLNENWGDDGHVLIKYKVDRASLDQHNIPNELVDSDSMRFDIESETPYTFIVNNRDNAGLRLAVKVKKDYKNFKLLAAQIKNKYALAINQQQLSHFAIIMTVDSPSCRLCSSKSYDFSYDIMQYLKR